MPARPVLGAELLIAAAPGDIGRIEELIRVWEQSTGNSVVWLATRTDEALQNADLLIAPWHEVLHYVEQESTLPLHLAAASGPVEIAPLFTAPVATDNLQVYKALPVPMDLPLLHIDARRLAERGISLPGELSWAAVIELAAQLADPLDDASGFCLSPDYRHATAIRAMLADASQPWLGSQTQEPFAGRQWLEQARRYARLQARSGDAAAARMSQAHYVGLVRERRCAIRLAPWRPARREEAMVYAPVPGVEAFVASGLLLAAVAGDVRSPAAALDLVWWLVSTEAAQQLGFTGVQTSVPGAVAGQARQAFSQQQVQAWSSQEPGFVAERGEFSWSEIDELGEAALSRLVDGIVPAEQALAEAGEGLSAAD